MAQVTGASLNPRFADAGTNFINALFAAGNRERQSRQLELLEEIQRGNLDIKERAQALAELKNLQAQESREAIGGELTNFSSLLGGGDQQALAPQQTLAPQQDLQQILADQFDPRSVDPLGISGRAAGQTGAESLRFGTPPPDLLPAVTPRSQQSQEQVIRSLGRLQTLDRTGKSFEVGLKLLELRDAKTLANEKRLTERNFKESDNLLRIKDPVALERGIIQTINDRAKDGLPSPGLQRILALPPERRVVGLEQRKATNTDVKLLIENQQKELERQSKEEVARLNREATTAKTAKFENIFNEKGEVVAQRNTVTGEVKKSPLAVGGQAEKGTFTKSPAVIIENPDGTFSQSIPVLDSRTGIITNKLSPIPGIPVSRLGETAEAETIRQIREKRLIKRAQGEESAIRTTINDGITAAEGLGTINRSIELMKNIKTGGIEGAKIRFRQFLGIEGADEAELTANLLRTVLAQLRPTFGAQFTEAEGRRLEGIEAGIGKSTAGNLRLLQQLKVIINREARRGLSGARKIKDEFAIEEIERLLKFKISTPKKKSFKDMTLDELLAQ